MIIADILPTRATPERYKNLVGSAVAAHMNMIRVWGGGVYPPQDFYDLCDEMGVMVWQEAMMACALYPRDDVFLQEVSDLLCSYLLSLCAAVSWTLLLLFCLPLASDQLLSNTGAHASCVCTFLATWVSVPAR